MNQDFEIYHAPKNRVPPEDKARLDGYLRAKAEMTEEARLKKELDDLREYRELVERRVAERKTKGAA